MGAGASLNDDDGEIDASGMAVKSRLQVMKEWRGDGMPLELRLSVANLPKRDLLRNADVGALTLANVNLVVLHTRACVCLLVCVPLFLLFYLQLFVVFSSCDNCR
jgi:hypothetical protein